MTSSLNRISMSMAPSRSTLNVELATQSQDLATPLPEHETPAGLTTCESALVDSSTSGAIPLAGAPGPSASMPSDGSGPSLAPWVQRSTNATSVLPAAVHRVQENGVTIAQHVVSRGPGADRPGVDEQANEEDADGDGLSSGLLFRHVQAIERGVLLYTENESGAPTYLYASLAIPGSDRARLAPLTIRYKGKNVLARLESHIRIAILAATKNALGWTNANKPFVTLPPRAAISRTTFVDVTYSNAAHFEAAKRFDQFQYMQQNSPHTLQRHIIGSSLPDNVHALLVSGLPATFDKDELIRGLWTLAAMVGHPVDVWEIVRDVPLLEVEAEPAGRFCIVSHLFPDMRLGQVGQVLPGWTIFQSAHYPLQYAGRADWCRICEWRAQQPHGDSHCPRSARFRYGRREHRATERSLPTQPADTNDTSGRPADADRVNIGAVGTVQPQVSS